MCLDHAKSECPHSAFAEMSTLKLFISLEKYSPPTPHPHPQNEKQHYMHNLVFNNPTKLELDQLRTYWKIQLTLSLVSILSVTSVTLKYGQVNQQCHKQTKFTKLYHQAKFDIYHTYSLQQNWNVDVFAMKNWSVRQPCWQPGTDHYTCRLDSFYMYAS